VGLMGGLLGMRARSTHRLALDMMVVAVGTEGEGGGKWRLEWAAPDEVHLKREGAGEKTLVVNCAAVVVG
jgi:hypothetical protein